METAIEEIPEEQTEKKIAPANFGEIENLTPIKRRKAPTTK